MAKYKKKLDDVENEMPQCQRCDHHREGEIKNNVPFYTKHGFFVMENGTAIQICNYSNQQ